MSLLLLLYGTGEEAQVTPTPTLEEEADRPILGGMYLASPKGKRKRKPRFEAQRNYAYRLLREDEELLVLLEVMDENS